MMPGMTEPPAAAPDHAALARGLAGGCFVEAGLQVSAHFQAAVAVGGLGAALRTGTAHALPLASQLVAAAVARWHLSEECRRRLDIVLHEAIANAILHGNLAIGPTPGLAERFARIDARLAEPDRAARPVEVTLCPRPGGVAVTVADAGEGFDLAASLGRTAAPEAQSGRGLALIQAVAQSLSAEEDGRRLCISVPI